ncbi:MAG: aspartate carbamoyltransferase catalytic subunit [Deltaproteobacteria bacterium]|nr:MAG: aspartate carbamoyltransferase catalytic subunit [Deltaproteobacteria bacterium]
MPAHKKKLNTNPPSQAEGFFLALKEKFTGKLPKDCLEIKSLSRNQIETILDLAQEFKEKEARGQKKHEDLKGKALINIFFEPSTRTRTSFELAGRRLSADMMTIAPQASSLSKGESLKDMIENLEAMGPDLMVVRHAASGAPGLIASYTKAAVVNAGDGSHEHPTQALLDAFTVKEKLGEIQGKHLVIVGDISYSRVARSNIYAFCKLGGKVTCVGPATLIPPGIEKMGAKVETDLDKILPHADAVMFLRIQKERQEKMNFPSIAEYTRFYGMNRTRWAALKKEALIMHPGPINRGVEIEPEIADGRLEGGAQTVILDQVKNGTAVRMAVLSLWGRSK